MFLFAAALIIAGVALFVAAPLGNGLIGARRKSTSELDFLVHEHERAHAVQGLRELEFDREMGKLSDADYGAMRAGLESRALNAMTAIEKIRAEERQAQEKKAQEKKSAEEKPQRPHLAPIKPYAAAPLPTPPPPISAPRRIEPAAGFSRNAPGGAPTFQRIVRFCPQCGTRAAVDANFCAECGLAFKPVAPATNWNE